MDVKILKYKITKAAKNKQKITKTTTTNSTHNTNLEVKEAEHAGEEREVGEEVEYEVEALRLPTKVHPDQEQAARVESIPEVQSPIFGRPGAQTPQGPGSGSSPQAFIPSIQSTRGKGSRGPMSILPS